MTVLPAAGPDSKPANAQALRTDALYFADELVRRLEALHRRQGTNRIWPAAAAIARRVRAVIRAENERQR